MATTHSAADFAFDQGDSIDLSGEPDYPMLDNLLQMSTAFGDTTLTCLIIKELTRRYPSTLVAWTERPEPEDGLGEGGFGDLRRKFEALALIKRHGFHAALPAVLYDICQDLTPVSHQVIERRNIKFWVASTRRANSRRQGDSPYVVNSPQKLLFPH